MERRTTAGRERRETPAGGEINRLADHLFREEAGKLVSVLTRIFGLRNLQMAEDVVQEALVRALETWPYYGVPDKPAAWLTQTAKNLALDRVRREKRFREKCAEISAELEEWSRHPDEGGSPRLRTEVRDARLRLLFACCHPAIPPESQTALALKTLCGFGVTEIASAFLTTEAAVAKRLTRARTRLREANIPFAIPAGAELSERMGSVLHTLYLLFNEGYKASTGDSLIREEMCAESIRLTALLAGHPAGDEPRTHALLALMLLNAARLPARVDEEGNLLRLQEQDRSRWNRAMIARGMEHLKRSASGDGITAWHIEAGIAACHAVAPDYASTDWAQILRLYDQLVEIDPSPVAALNRAVAVAEVRGARAGLEALEALPGLETLESYYLFYAVRAELAMRLGRLEAAAADLNRALQLTAIRSEQKLLSEKLRQVRAEG